MRVLGVDPGLRITGYGCIVADPSHESLVEAGVIRLVKSSGEAPPIASRLDELDREFRDILARLAPDAVAIEGLFAHYKHPATAIVMGHARGVLLLAAKRWGATLIELKPAEVKKSTTGHGAATKPQIQQAVADRLRLDAIPKPADVADALAIALTAADRAAATPEELGAPR